MSNKGGRSKKHCLVGFKRPKSSMSKRTNKEKARARKEEALNTFQSFMRGC